MTETNKTIIFCAVAAVVATLAFISQPSALEPDFKNETGTKFFPDFDDPLRSTQLEILEYDETLGEVRTFRVAKADEIWSIPSHENYPADAEKQLAEAAVLEDRTAEGQRLLLAPLVGPPTASDPVAEDIVETEALELGADVALVGFLSVIGVLVAAPVVYIIKIVGHVPLAQGGDQRIETLDPHLRGGAALAARKDPRYDFGWWGPFAEEVGDAAEVGVPQQ